jgi:hypothetical protein
MPADATPNPSTAHNPNLAKRFIVVSYDKARDATIT